jgi:acyl-coenzyme A thioesterase PaaI-like protein
MEPLNEGSIAKQLDVRDDHWCFGCGRLNPNGLKLTFYESENGPGIWTEWTPSRANEGFSGIAHGGIITTVLDEVMGWAVSHRNVWAVTGRLDVSFRRPVETGVPTVARAWIETQHGRKLDVRARLERAADAALLAEASAIFVKVPPERALEFTDRYLARVSGGDRDESATNG